MELRRTFSHFHHIRTIKDGKEAKSPNVWHGKPGLKFRSVGDLYEKVEGGRHRSSARHRMIVRLQELPEPRNGEEGKVENPTVAGGRRRVRIKRENEDSDASCSHGGREPVEARENEDDLEFFNLTLKQIRVRFMAKKRKRASCPPVELDHSPSKSEDDDSDLMESLRSLAARIVKNKKTKRRMKRLSDLNLSQHVVKFEEAPNCYESPCHSDAGDPEHVDVKVEVSESDDADCQAIVLSDTDISCNWIEPLASFIFPSDVEPGLIDEGDGEIPETGYVDYEPIDVDDLDESYGWLVPFTSSEFSFDEQPGSSFEWDTEMAIPSESPDEPVKSKGLDLQTEEPVIANCGAFQPLTSDNLSYEHQRCSVDSDFQTEEIDTAKADVFHPLTITYYNELQNCSVNKESYEHLEKAGPQPSPPCANMAQHCASNEESDKDLEHDVPPVSMDDVEDLGVGFMVGDITEVDVHQLTKNPSSSQYEKVDLVVDSLRSDELGESASRSKDPCSTAHGHSKDDLFISDGEMQSNTSQIEITEKDTNECTVDSSNYEGEAKGEKTYLEIKVESCTGAVVVENQVKTSCANSSLIGCLSSHSVDSSSDASSPSVVLAQSTNPCADQPVQLVDGEDCCTIMQQQQPPERLLSTRKAISPTSQEKLRKAMESNELDDEQVYKYARKLCYRERTGSNQVKRAANTVIPQQLAKKLKCSKPSCPPNDSPKAARLVRRPPRFSTGCTSIHSCSENAIMFTQNQMLDFESMATKLAKELKSMKEIVESTLQCGVNLCASPKYTHQQVSGAIEKATRVEETARRWISTMGRDCDRFCKLMKLAQNSSSSSMHVEQKEKRKKISFADEAGGKLCHVKTFKSEAESMESSSIAEEAIILD